MKKSKVLSKINVLLSKLFFMSKDYVDACKYAEKAYLESRRRKEFKNYIYALLKSDNPGKAMEELLADENTPDFYRAEFLQYKDNPLLTVKLAEYLGKYSEIRELLLKLDKNAVEVKAEMANLCLYSGNAVKALELYGEIIRELPGLLDKSVILNKNVSEAFTKCGYMNKGEIYKFKALELEERILKKKGITKKWMEEGIPAKACNLCGKTSFKTVLKRPDGIDIICCENCGLHFVNPMIKENILKEIYDKHYYSGGNVFGYRTNYFQQNKFEIWKQRMSAVENYTAPFGEEPKKVLDIGCANGGFLEFCKNQGWKVQGVDLSADACAEAIKKGLDVFCGDIKDAGFKDNTFDCITMWDLIEHLTDPMADLKEMERILKPGGIMAIATPNLLKSYLMKENWPGFNCSYEHLYYFTPATVIKYMDSLGLEVELCFSYERENFTMSELGHILIVLARKISAFNIDKGRLNKFEL